MTRLWKRRNLILGIILLSYIFLGLYISYFPLEYKAVVILDFYPAAYEINDITDITTIQSLSPELTQDEENILRSELVLNTAIKKLNLETDPEFNVTTRHHKIINSLFLYLQKKLEGKNTDYIYTPRDNLNSKISISFIGFSEIAISVVSTSPKLAALIANTIAEIYSEQPSEHGKKHIQSIAEIPSFAYFSKYYFKIILTGFISLLFGAILAWNIKTKENIGIYGL